MISDDNFEEPSKFTKLNSSDESSSIADLDSSSDDDDLDLKTTKGYKCSNCSVFFEQYKNYKSHSLFKNSMCKQCKQVFFCCNMVAAHLKDCIKGAEKKHFVEKRPNPRYIKAIEEHIKKRDAIYKNTVKKQENIKGEGK
ncbi:hypothetical protein SteCoe_37961 [Stentor coeruleus]|uniref:Uncharacterized protein n=1 Tax=Stentor coeruleus TaxID=5963 RepID=A0A1R2AM46_9CILI|nr:hypothetical protein SteCoe_37961 [Stentor coeruleus]